MLTREQIIKRSVLKYWMLSDVETLFHAMRMNTIGEGDERHVFIDNKADILCVAHLDTVQDVSDKVKLTQNKLKASGLDDRLGAYLCAILPTLGINADILLTDNEETGRSTAQYFNTKKHYNWVVEFDRMGSDAVTYGLNSPEWLAELKRTGVKHMHGSFSDLCYLKIPGDPCMVNFGIGYYEPHSLTSYARLQELVVNMNRFKLFYDRNKDIKYEQTNANTRHKGQKYDNTKTQPIGNALQKELEDEYDRWYNAKHNVSTDDEYECYYCHNVTSVDPIICPDCGAQDSYLNTGDFK